MDHNQWYPFAPDPSTGASAAEDQQRLDGLVAVIAGLLADAPVRRPRVDGAPAAVSPVSPAAPRVDWPPPAAPDGPPTIAAALEAAPWLMRR